MSRHLILALFVVIGTAALLEAQPEASKTATHVKVTTTATRPDSTGKQEMCITLTIDKNYMLIGHRVCAELESARLKVDFTVKGNPVEAEVTYPQGQREDKAIGDYEFHEGTATVKAVLRRMPGDVSPLELTIRMQGFPRPTTY